MKFVDVTRCSLKHFFILVLLTAIVYFMYIYRFKKRILHEHAVRNPKYVFFDLGANNGDSMVKFFFNRKFDLIKGIYFFLKKNFLKIGIYLNIKN